MDLRKKACTNENCKSYKLKKYSANINYCPECGTKLIYVCSSHNCFKPLDISEPKHRICAECEAKRDDKMNQFKDFAATGVVGVAGIGVNAFKKPIVGGIKKAGNILGDKVVAAGVDAVKNIIH